MIIVLPLAMCENPINRGGIPLPFLPILPISLLPRPPFSASVRLLYLTHMALFPEMFLFPFSFPHLPFAHFSSSFLFCFWCPGPGSYGKRGVAKNFCEGRAQEGDGTGGF